MMRYIFLGLFSISLFSCEVKKDDIEYRVERVNYIEFYTIKLINKNNAEITSLSFDNNDTIISYSVIDDSRGFNSVVNLKEDGILSYSIYDRNKYSNTTNLIVDDELILTRSEQINENTIYVERIYRNGLVVKEKQ